MLRVRILITAHGQILMRGQNEYKHGNTTREISEFLGGSKAITRQNQSVGNQGDDVLGDTHKYILEVYVTHLYQKEQCVMPCALCAN